MEQKKYDGKNQGITLIALVITIIVMLILVGVTITMAVNGGLFEQAGKAASQTNEAKRQELLIAEGKVEVGGKVYNTLDEYVAEVKGNGGIVEPKDLDDWTWVEEEDGTVTITEYKGTDTAVVIPNRIEGKQVKKIAGNGYSSIFEKDGDIGDRYFSIAVNNTITSIVVSEGITTIDTRAFEGLRAVQSLKLPQSLTTIGQSAFSCCDGMESITIPKNVTTVGSDAFSGVGGADLVVSWEEKPDGWNSNWNHYSDLSATGYASAMTS